MLFKKQFQNLYSALATAGYNPTMADLQRIILDRAPKIIKSRVAGRAEVVISSKGAILREYLVREESNKAQREAKATGATQVHYNAIYNEKGRSFIVPTTIAEAYNALPESLEALDTIKKYTIAGNELMEAVDLNNAELQ